MKTPFRIAAAGALALALAACSEKSKPDPYLQSIPDAAALTLDTSASAPAAAVTAAVGSGLALGLKIPFGTGAARAQAATPEINAWVVIKPDDAVVIRVARSEMGQGTITGLAQLLAEELGCDWSKVTTEPITPGRSLALAARQRHLPQVVVHLRLAALIQEPLRQAEVLLEMLLGPVELAPVQEQAAALTVAEGLAGLVAVLPLVQQGLLVELAGDGEVALAGVYHAQGVQHAPGGEVVAA